MRIRKRDFRRWRKAIVSYVLIAAMILGLVPQSAYAAGTDPAATEKTYTSDGFTITYKESSAWGNYVNAEVTLKNETDSAKSLWQVTFDYDGAIDSVWNADITSSENGTYVLSAKTYNSTIGVGQSVSFGFMAHGTEKKPSIPESITFADTDDSGSAGSDDGSGSTEEGDSGEPGVIIPGQSYEIPEQWSGLNYAMFTSGGNGLSFYTGNMQVTGSVHTNQDFYYQGGSLAIDGTLEAGKSITLKTSDGKDAQNIRAKREKAKTLEMPDITKEVSDYAKENGTVYEGAADFGSDPVVIDQPVYGDGDMVFHSTSFLGKGIVYGKGSVTVNTGELTTPSDARIFLASESGDITLNGSNISLNAVLYAPNGCVTINANEFHLNGRIIAKQICINGTVVTVHAGPYDLDMLDFLFRPEIDIAITGNRKENRKVVFDVEEILNTDYIVKEDTIWSITKDGEEAGGDYAIDEDVSDAFHKECIFRNEGTYMVSVTVTTGKVQYTVTKELVIVKDMEPVASFTMDGAYYGRNEEGKAAVTLTDQSSSPDGDIIGQRIWKLYYDENNDGVFSETEASIINDGNETELTYETDRVGKYRVVLTVFEIFEDTIPKLLSEDAYLKDDTEELQDCIFEVGNEAPTAELHMKKSRSADIVFTMGDTGKDNLNVYTAKAEALKTILTENGIDAKVDAISTSTYTAQDTFAWKEYSHYNCDGYENHIIYEEDSICMVGYRSLAIKDFLYIADDKPGQKTFEFDLQRDGSDWHSMEGAGFLFNTTVSDEENTVKGFCILVSPYGLKIVQIDCPDLKRFCDGYYNWVQYAGKLLTSYPISNLYAEHHFKIVVDARTISLWDGDELIIDNFVLPENDYGYGYGPIISHASHGCRQRSYFTFKNITMQSTSGSNLSDIIDGYEWRPGASHYVINLSDVEVPELSTEETTADLSAALIRNEAAFIGIGNENNENQYLNLLNTIQTGGMYVSQEDLSSRMDDINGYLLQSILSKDDTIGDSITTDDIVSYGGFYQDAENDALYEQQWEYEYDPSIFSTATGEAGHIVRNENEPLTVFENTGAYAIRLAVRDNPAGENDALDEYRLWSDTKEYEKLLVVQSRPVAQAEVTVSGDKDQSYIANTVYSAYDPDHPEDSSKGIREQYFYYKDMADTEWTEGKLPNKLAAGHTYLVKYQVKDVEGTLSFPAVAVVKTDEVRDYEEIEDTTPPTVYIDMVKTEIQVGEELYIDGYALDDYGVDSFELYVDDEKVLDAFGRIVYKGAEAGSVTVKAVATDIGGNRSEKEVVIRVADNRDKTAPTAEITSPTEGSELGFQVQIKGTAADETKFSKYTLSYREQSETEYHVFKESKDAVTDDILGSLDISGFQEGTYEILLTVEDAAGNVSYCGLLLYLETGVARGYTISGELKDIELTKNREEIQVHGSAGAEGHMKKYTLSYRMDDKEDIILIAEGSEEITDGVLGTLKTEDLISGTYHLILTVEDTAGNSGTACGSFEYIEGEGIDADLNPPVAELTGVKLSEDKKTIEIKASVSDDKELEGYTLSYAPEGGSEYTKLCEGTKKLDNELIAQLKTEDLTDGTYELCLEARDTYGNSCTYTMKFTYQKGSESIETGGGNGEEGTVPTEPVKREFAVNLSYSAAPMGTKVQVQVTLPEDMAEESLVIMQDDKELAAGTRKTAFTSDKAGKVTITAIGTDAEGNEKRVTAECTFFNDKDKKAPKAEITSPTIDQVLTEPVDIKGSAYDEEALDFWKIEYRMKGDKDYQLLAEGTEAKKDEVLCRFDTTMLMNGQYEVRLWVQDQGGNITKLENDYVVEGELKVGAMHIGFTDITAPMGGTTVSVNRMYDSRNKSRGDFGIGWTLGVSGMEVYENHSIGDGYEMVKTGSLFSTGYQMTETENHDVTITYGDGTSDRFELTFTPERQALVPISEVKVGYRCVTNQKVKLEIIGDATAEVSGGELFFYDENMYDGLNYKLTTEDGNTIYLNQKKGAYKITDTSGNIITIDDDGYHSEDGKSIRFTRDSENRITKAEDPAGNTITYAYDDNGDLTSVTDFADRTVSFTYDKKHNLMSITDPMGIAVARNEYDDEGRLTATIDADGNRIAYDYDVEGRTEAVKDRRGNTTVYTYDDNGNVLQTIDAYGHKTTNTYDEYNNLLSTTDANGNTTAYAYDTSGNITSVTAADGTTVHSTYTQDNYVSGIQMMDQTVMAMEYDSKGRLTTVEDANGNETSYTYASDGKLTGMTDAIGQVQQVTYDKDGNVASTTNGAGESASYTYDKDGRCTGVTISRVENGETLTFTSHYSYNAAGDIVESIDNAGNTTAYEYDANGNRTASVDARGNRITYVYDELGNMTKVTYPDGTGETFTYDANGNNTTATDRSGLKVTMQYDKLDRMTEKIYADGSKETYTYDAAGNVTETVSVSGAKTTYTYDNRNRNTSITDTYGNQTTFTYDEAARLLSRRDALGNTVSYDYDDNGNIIKTTYADGNSVTSKYDARNRVISQKDQYGNETSYTYDGADRLTSVTDAYGNSYTYGYDYNGNLVTVTDAKEQVTAYTYDAVGRVAGIRNALGKTMEYTYDEAGNVIQYKDYAGTITKYAYDDMNRLVKKTVGSLGTTYTYNDTGLLTKVTDADGSITYAYDRYDRLVSKTDARGIRLSYTYDEVGRLASFDNGFGKTKYEYDLLDRVTRVIDRNGQATVYEYDALGNRSVVRYPNGNVVTYTYDACQRLKEECIVNGNDVQLSKYSYGIGKAGERTSVTEVNSGVETEITYKYDKLNRLTKETVESGDSRLINTYTYDAVSNRTEKKTTVKGDISALADTDLEEIELTEGTTVYTYNALNQLITEVSEGKTKTYTYDANGNLIKQSGDKIVDYSYDKENHLIKATIQKGNSVTIESYTYDYAGNLTSKTLNESDTIYYVNDTSSDLSQVVAEVDEDGKEKTSYIRGDHAELLSMEQNGKAWYYLCDGHGSVRILTNEAGRITDRYSYDAYGNLLEKEGDTENDFLYTGEQYNANTGLYYLRARYMNPSTGTFISMDSYQGNIYDPVTLHKYLYANANPVMYTDPSGYMTDMSLANTVTDVIILVTLTTAVVFHDQVMLNIFSSMRRNVADATVEQTCTVSSGDWKSTILGFPAHQLDNRWIVTRVTWLLSRQLFQFINEVKDADEDIDTPGIPDEPNDKENENNDNEPDKRKKNPEKGNSKIWKDLDNVKGKDRKTSGKGKNKKYYEWDHTHNDIEVYDKNGKHLGTMDPTTGEMYKPPVPGREIKIN